MQRIILLITPVHGHMGQNYTLAFKMQNAFI